MFAIHLFFMAKLLRCKPIKEHSLKTIKGPIQYKSLSTPARSKDVCVVRNQNFRVTFNCLWWQRRNGLHCVWIIKFLLSSATALLRPDWWITPLKVTHLLTIFLQAVSRMEHFYVTLKSEKEITYVGKRKLVNRWCFTWVIFFCTCNNNPA